MRKSHKLQGAVLRADQIKFSGEHTKVDPFNLNSHEKGNNSIYKRNEDAYQQSIRDSLTKAAIKKGGASERLAAFKEMEEMKHGNLTDQIRRKPQGQKLEPFALFCDREGKRVNSSLSAR